MNQVGYRELRAARRYIIAQAGAKKPGWGSMDSLTPMVKFGLEVVEFEVAGSVRFANQIAERHEFRINVAKGDYAITLFSAAILSGVTYGAMAERNRMKDQHG
jgi:hypothetical protein